MCRDYQKAKVYSWESRFPEGRLITFVDATQYVSCIWNAQKLQWPPLVQELPAQDKHAGKANRQYVMLPAHGATEKTILHELAHSMTATHDGYIDAHGPKFVGVYMRLLCHHLSVPLPLLIYSASKAGLDYDIHAKPWCGR
jgi:hypothetical protein